MKLLRAIRTLPLLLTVYFMAGSVTLAEAKQHRIHRRNGQPPVEASMTQTSPARSTLELLLGEENNFEQSSTNKKEPRVKKFQNNIYYDGYYRDSAMADYVSAFYTGYNMQDYAFAEECDESAALFLDEFHEMHLNVTRRFTWVDPYFLTGSVVGNEFNDSWFYCYQWWLDIRADYAQKAENFVDFGDIYLSFIFNLLGNSLHIKSASENMVESNRLHDTATFVQNGASILRILLDFDSYKQAGMSYSAVTRTAERLQAARDSPRATNVLESDLDKMSKKDAMAKRTQTNLETIRKSSLRSGNTQKVQRGGGYSWNMFDYLQSPFALLIGSLHALPDESFGYKCSKNTTSSRQSLAEAFDYNGQALRLEAITSLHDSIGYYDDMTLNCYYSFSLELTRSHFSNLFSVWWEIPVNLLYNAGYQWIDVRNYLFYTPETVPQGDWAFFVTYIFGDFIMRFFYRDETP